MNRLLVSAIGVILTFCWIIYTAPDRPENGDRLLNEPIKKISKSGSGSLPDTLNLAQNASFYRFYTNTD